MALTRTTLAAAMAVGDASLLITSATSVAAGSILLIDLEQCKVTKAYVSGSTTVPVLRGQGGTIAVAHPITASVTHGTGSDFSDPAGGVIYGTNFPPSGRTRDCVSYTTAGAIALPSPGSDRLVILNSTVALAMTLANPTKDMDGVILIVGGNGKAAHTVTYTTTGFGGVGGTADVLTFSATQAQAFQCIALNSVWNLLGPLATATADVSGPSLA